MVLEHIFPDYWLEKKSRYGFILGFIYSIFGIALAKLLFPKDPALVAVAFTSLLLLPELSKMFAFGVRKEENEKKFSIRDLLRDNFPFIKTYLFLFLGILLAYSLATMFLPSLEVNSLFQEQLEYRGGDNVIVKKDSSIAIPFMDLLKNNMMVLIVCFLISLFTGDGAIFIITWNASLWGTVFGITAKNAAIISQISPLVYFLVIMGIVLPHVLLEALAYISAAISGGVISKDVLLEKFDSRRFNMVFFYNFALFLIAVLFLIFGSFVEAYVLENFERYRQIVILSYQ